MLKKSNKSTWFVWLLGLLLVVFASSGQATSLWEDSPKSRTPYGDNIAVNEGDLVKITIAENAMGRTDSSRDREKDMEVGGSSGENANNSSFFNSIAGFIPFFGATVSGGSQYESERAANVSGTLNAEMSVSVVGVSENGVLDLEGSREIKIEDEIKTLQFTGQARKADVKSDNTIPSDRIANAQIKYEGKLGVQSGEAEGFLSSTWVSFKNFLFW